MPIGNTEAELLIHEVILFLKYSFHKSVLEPIYKELSNLEIRASIESRRHVVYDTFNLSKRKYPIFVIADEWTSLFRDCSETLIALGHSPANKNTTLSNRNSEADYIFCQSQYYKNEFIRRGILPKKEIIVTGNPAASRLFRREMNPNSVFSRFAGPDSMRILFAPTYNRDLNIMDALIREEKESDLFDRLKDFNIVFKVHPVLPKKYPEHIEFIKKLAQRTSNIYYHEESHDDITDAILWSDIAVGDCSGALFLAAAGGKPVIAYDNPNRFKSEYFDKEGPEWKFREEYAYRISDSGIKDLPEIIRGLSSKAGDYKSEKRESVIDLLFEHQEYAEMIIAKDILNILLGVRK